MSSAARYQPPHSLPLWEQVVRRMLAEGVNFDKPKEGMTILQEVLIGNDNATPAPCGTCDRCPECVACHCPTGDHNSPFCAVCLNDGDADEWLGRQK